MLYGGRRCFVDHDKQLVACGAMDLHTAITFLTLHSLIAMWTDDVDFTHSDFNLLTALPFQSCTDYDAIVSVNPFHFPSSDQTPAPVYGCSFL
jgi:hypothetical protein